MHEIGTKETEWVSSVLGGTPASIDTIAGGGNNRVFRVVSGSGRPYLLKQYFWDPGDSRDRLGNEYGLVDFAWSAGLRCIPEPVARNNELHLGLYSFIEGRKIQPADVNAQAIDQALDFVIHLNRHRMNPAAQKLSKASEACFSVREHLDRIDGRIKRLAEGVADPRALSFVQKALEPSWSGVKKRTEKAFTEDAARQTLAKADCCLTPSDFGFHNALMENGRLVFLDFEYAGWDDPAKLTGDFFSQVAIPAPATFIPEFISRFAESFADKDGTANRMRALLPAYRIKWCCILLNEFLPVDQRRRSFAQDMDPGVRQAQQLEKAVNHLANMRAVTIDL